MEEKMTRTLARAALAALVLLSVTVSSAGAQALTGQLGGLLTDTGTLPAGFVADPAAAAATRDAVAGLFVVEFGALPLVSSSAGFVYRLNPSLGVIERATDNFGAFYTERAARSGRRRASFGINFQSANFASLQGATLTAGSFPTNAQRTTGASQPFGVDTLSLSLDAQTTTPYVTVGVTDRLDLNVAMPIVRVSFSGRRTTTVAGQTSLQSARSASATGLGDATISARYRLAERGPGSLAAGADLRLPTGREEDLLGAGKTAARFMAIGSWEAGRLGVHGNAGIGLGGLSREAFWAGATTIAVTPRVTAVGEITGRRLSELTVLGDVYAPHSTLAGVETMRWVPVGKGVQTAFFVTGVKVNVAGSLLLNASLMVRLNDSGLRARVTPNISFSYALER
jgi:hypothetical protein